MASSPPCADDPAPNRDETAMALLRAGQHEGLRMLAEDHGGAVLTVLQRSFRGYLPAPDVDDAMQAAFVRMWRNPRAWEPEDGTLRAWLFVVARNVALSIVRQRQRRRRDISIDQVEELLLQLADTPADQERLRRVADLHACLRELPARQRAVLEADLGGGDEAIEQLAVRLRMSPRAIVNARHRGRARLAVMMRALGHYVGRPANADASVATEFG